MHNFACAQCTCREGALILVILDHGISWSGKRGSISLFFLLLIYVSFISRQKMIMAINIPPESLLISKGISESLSELFYVARKHTTRFRYSSFLHRLLKITILEYVFLVYD
jgi:hypothetical protein